jgi:sigma-B regulation protein RsbU (phosphoserine phosphatase)
VREQALTGVLAAFYDATRCPAAVWVQRDVTQPPTLLGCAPAEPPPAVPDADTLPLGPEPHTTTGPAGRQMIARVPPAKRAWVIIGPEPSDGLPLANLFRFLAPVISQMLQNALEVEHAATELAERYEEINLLYTISEILGRTVRLEEAAATILKEISETAGARKASILVHDRVTDTLQVVAALGIRPEDAPPIAVDDACSVSAKVFRTRRATIVERNEMECAAEALYRTGAMLSVPIMWTSPDGGEPLGVVNLSDRRSGQPFSAGDQKLVAAIATQIGTAIQNTRLVRASLAQQRLVQEMQLAHDLQMKLLPMASVVAPDADVSARVIPANSVGGDFYNLFRLSPGATGAMIGDVSSHGYQAALIMALAMSASAIHAQSTMDPAETLAALQASLRDELATTEMFISAFYGVVDRRNGELRYANTGHPHAFVIGAEGEIQRLPALDPPLGMVTSAPHGSSRPWSANRDLLLLFTDGVSDARNRAGTRLGEQAVLDSVTANRAQPTTEIVERVFAMLSQHMGDVPPRDDLTLVVLRS